MLLSGRNGSMFIYFYFAYNGKVFQSAVSGFILLVLIFIYYYFHLDWGYMKRVSHAGTMNINFFSLFAACGVDPLSLPSLKEYNFKCLSDLQ